MASVSNSPITQVSQDSSPITQVSPAPAPSPSQYYVPSQHSYPTRLILDLRGTRFEIERETLVGLPESILVVMFPNGLILRPQTTQARRGRATASSMGQGTGGGRGSSGAAGSSGGPGTGGGHHPSESTYTDYSDYSDYSYDDYDEDEDDYRDDPNGAHEEELDDSEEYEEEEEEPQVIQVDFDPVCLQYILEFYREAQRASEAQRRLRLQEQQQMLQMQRQRLQQQQKQLLLQQQQKQGSSSSDNSGDGGNGEATGVTAATTLPTAAAEGLIGGQSGPSLPEPSSSQPVPLSSILPQNPLLNKQAIIVLREELDYFAIPPSSKASNTHNHAATPELTPIAAVIAPSTSTATTSTVATIATSETAETAASPPVLTTTQGRNNTKLSSPAAPSMIKTQCGQKLLEDRKIFAALQRNINKEKNQAEQHLMDMLCVSGFHKDGEWGYRRLEPKRTTVVSVAMVMLRTTAVTSSSSSTSSSSAATATMTATTALKVANALKGINGTTTNSGTTTTTTTITSDSGIQDNSNTTVPSQASDKSGNINNNGQSGGKDSVAGPSIQEQNQIQMAIAQKLLLFWRKPARKCWWDGIQVEIDQELDGSNGIKVPVRLWARRTWTLELILV
ncbi:hypothetical protein BGX27_006184 [Mortierella sp. AM989]|nr:hypothetical protein BGX27_006184 [Mortierella sp. AM989]